VELYDFTQKTLPMKKYFTVGYFSTGT